MAFIHIVFAESLWYFFCWPSGVGLFLFVGHLAETKKPLRFSGCHDGKQSDALGIMRFFFYMLEPGSEEATLN